MEETRGAGGEDIITLSLNMIIMYVVPNGDALSTADRIRGIIVVVLVWVLAAISNTLNVVAVALRMKK